MYSMKEFWLRKEECTGCASCANICPKNAIELKKDDCGFVYPNISEACVDCNLCVKVCEKRLKIKTSRITEPYTYAVWSEDKDTRFKSTSGGAFSELARIILKQGGYIAGAAYNDKNLVEHILVNNEEGLSRIRQSKYLQSEIGFIYQEVKKLLAENKLVGFCGAPCQVAGLYAFLDKDYDNLITFDFICRGMNSPKAYESWLRELENQNSSKVLNVWFKYKVNGWKKSPRCTKVDFENGNSVILKGNKNLFMTGYLGPNLYIRPSCGNCDFKGIPRYGDITLADFWGIEPQLDDDKGTSMVLVNSVKGSKLFLLAEKQLHVIKRDFQEIFQGNVCFDLSVKINSQSEEFLQKLDEISFSRAIQKYGRISILEKIKQKFF